MKQLDHSKFDHVGLVTDVQQPNERWAEATRLSSTNPRQHPYNIEFLRFEPDSPVTGPLRTDPHIAYRVDDLEAALEGQEVVLGPIETPGFATRAFVAAPDGLAAFMPLVELIQYDDPNEKGWA